MDKSPSADAEFRRIFDEHHDALQRYCLRRLSSGDVNDAMAEIFLVVWRRLDDVPEGSETRLWLYGVARNVVRNVVRQHHRSNRLTRRAEANYERVISGPETDLVRRSEERELIEALSTLPSNERELLQMKAWEELPNDEIGNLLGLSARAVAMRYNRALKKLGRTLRSSERSGFGLGHPRAMQGGEQ